MPDLYARLGASRDQFQALAQKYNLERLAVFGSFARSEETRDSDVDFLVRWRRPSTINLNRLMGARESLATLTGRQVDMVTEKELH